jgi:hypothetical protein
MLRHRKRAHAGLHVLSFLSFFSKLFYALAPGTCWETMMSGTVCYNSWQGQLGARAGPSSKRCR